MNGNNDNLGQICCVLSAVTALVSISEVQQIVSIAAGCMAIICGVFTSYYYHIKTKNLNNGKRN